MSQPETPRQEVLQIIRDHGPISMADIFDRCQLINDKKQVSNALYNLKHGQVIVKGADSRFSVVAVAADDAGPAEDGDIDSGWNAFLGRKPTTPATPPPAPASEPVAISPRPEQVDKRPPEPPAKTPGVTIIHALESAATAAQDALDEYIYAIADPRILDPLKRARDQAGEALALYLDAGA